MDTQNKIFYVLGIIVVLAAVILHLLEMGGPKAFRGKAILTLGTTGLLTGFNNLNLLIGSDGLSGIFVTFLALSTLSPPSPATAEHGRMAQDSSQVSPDIA